MPPRFKATRQKRGRLSELAERKGVEVEPARMTDCVVLKDAAGERIKHPTTGALAHTADSAIWILARMKDASV